MPILLTIVVPCVLALVTFLAAAAGDALETFFVAAVGSLRAHRAARLSVAMYVVSCIGWLTTIKVSLWYMIPEVLGLYAGTHFAVKRQIAQKQREALAQQTEQPHGAEHGETWTEPSVRRAVHAQCPDLGCAATPRA